MRPRYVLAAELRRLDALHSCAGISDLWLASPERAALRVYGANL